MMILALNKDDKQINTDNKDLKRGSVSIIYSIWSRFYTSANVTLLFREFLTEQVVFFNIIHEKGK